MTIQHPARPVLFFLFSALLTSLAGCTGSSSPEPRPDSGGDSGGGGDANDAGARDAGSVPLQSALIDDFEDGDGQASFSGAAWYLYDDSSNGGKSTLTFTDA